MSSFEDITATFFDEVGIPNRVPIAEFRTPRVDPFDRLLASLDEVVLDLPDAPDIYEVENLPPIVHSSKTIPELPSHGAGHTPKGVK